MTSLPHAQSVSWQSAFWALVAIAINTCLQYSGNICEVKSALGILIKSSPLFCLLDSIVVWFQIIYYMTRMKPRAALRHVASSREQHNADQPGNLFVKSIGGCLLLFLALAQALKLFALKGIPWTQAFGSMFLLSYLT